MGCCLRQGEGGIAIPKLGIARAAYSRLRLFRKSTVQRGWIKRVLHAVAQDIDDIDARVRGRAGLVITADAPRGEAEAGRAAAGRRARVRGLGRGTRQPRHGIHAGGARCFGGDVHGCRRGLVELALGGHCESPSDGGKRQRGNLGPTMTWDDDPVEVRKQ